jgi:hypothetical protein
VRIAVAVPPKLAEMVTGVEVATGDVVIANEALVLPAGTVIVCGTTAAGLSRFSETVRPFSGAGPFNVTVPWEISPPRTLTGLTASEVTAGGPTVREAVLVTPL